MCSLDQVQKRRRAVSVFCPLVERSCEPRCWSPCREHLNVIGSERKLEEYAFPEGWARSSELVTNIPSWMRVARNHYELFWNSCTAMAKILGVRCPGSADRFQLQHLHHGEPRHLYVFTHLKTESASIKYTFSRSGVRLLLTFPCSPPAMWQRDPPIAKSNGGEYCNELLSKRPNNLMELLRNSNGTIKLLEAMLQRKQSNGIESASQISFCLPFNLFWWRLLETRTRISCEGC